VPSERMEELAGCGVPIAADESLQSTKGRPRRRVRPQRLELALELAWTTDFHFQRRIPNARAARARVTASERSSITDESATGNGAHSPRPQEEPQRDPLSLAATSSNAVSMAKRAAGDSTPRSEDGRIASETAPSTAMGTEAEKTRELPVALLERIRRVTGQRGPFSESNGSSRSRTRRAMPVRWSQRHCELLHNDETKRDADRRG